MGDKSVQKKKYIVETAGKVFREKGFQNVTMKDIVEACGISRGGLYLYFDTTTEIFKEVLRNEFGDAAACFPELITEDATAADILLLFLEAQKKELFHEEKSLWPAVYEFYFVNSGLPKREHVLKKRFDTSVIIIQKLLEAGVENGEFHCEDCQGAARHIMYSLEGLKISVQTCGLTQQMADRELQYILKSLQVEEE